MKDAINPSHYKQYGIECKDIVKHLSWNQGCAIKYIWRCGLKDSSLQELNKALWHIDAIINDNEALIVEPQSNLLSLFVGFIENMEDWKKKIIYLILNNEFFHAREDLHKTIALIYVCNENNCLHG